MYKLIDTEITYVKCFSEYFSKDNMIVFLDDNLPDMYTHNYSLIKEVISSHEIVEIITKEIQRRKSEKKDFLQIEIDLQVSKEVLEELTIRPQVTLLDYMVIEANQYDTLGGNEECEIIEAREEKVLKDGIQVDILANSPCMGNEFAWRRIDRKAEIYQSEKPLSLYVCYHKGEPIGNCELFLNGTTAKIEDFDILEAYQRKGFGTSMLKYLIKRAKEQGSELIYLITDHDDTAKDMYAKCGFKLAGQKTQLHFQL